MVSGVFPVHAGLLSSVHVSGLLLLFLVRKRRGPEAYQASNATEGNPARSHRGFKMSDGLIDRSDIQICKRPDGSDWLLGQGSFGQVGLRFRV